MTYRKEEGEDLCKIHGFCVFYVFFLGLSYTLCLSLEILFKIRQPLLNSYSSRAIYYHAISHLGTIALLVLLGMSSEIGLSTLNRCFIKEGSWGNYLVLAFVSLGYPFAVLVALHSAISFSKTYDVRKRVYLLRYTIVMILYAFGWLPMVIAQITSIEADDLDTWNVVCWAFSSIAGFLANLIRLSDPAIMGKAKNRWKKDRSEALTASKSNESNSDKSVSVVQHELIDFFQDVLTEVLFRQGVISALISLHHLQASIGRGRFYKNAQLFTHKFNASAIDPESLSLGTMQKQCKCHTVVSYKFQVNEFYPMLFSGIRSGVEGLNFQASLSPKLNYEVLKKNIGNRGGKSDAFIFVTYDRKLILKSLSKKEKDFFLTDLLPGYEARISSEESLLARVLGVYTIKTSKGLKQHIMVMQNIIASPETIAIFDMKGSKLARKILTHDHEVPIEELPSYQTYKDLDFFHTQKQLYLSPQDSDRLIRSIREDVKMLRTHAIMDYSLLIAVGRMGPESNSHMFLEARMNSSRVYYVGIIDYLQLYDRKKQLEAFSKSLFHSRTPRLDISSVDSERYAKRFLELVEQIAQANS